MENLGAVITFYLTNFTMFLLGSYGAPFFVWVHKQLVECNANTFGVACTVVSVLFVIHLMWKYK
ncbi:hypothetical protein [Bacillus wiedmannii]|uniref:Uncharacterized protein n=1 Tax=Bacillus wiedmannii TaxID=1890302 RepID=A0A2C4PG68_9BACI|nr:hypothetical protein [Bacillus wiedmannii]MDA2116717.1 hypothetical protein [Bacillus cereus]MDA2133713.1 hypothetical protein [Bacillus cereus]PHD57684.1 hypothetical protein COF57_22700 [Bacillus wiedmannii]